MTEGIKEGIDYLTIIDLTKCFNLISNIYDFQSKESFALIYLINKQRDSILSRYEHIHHLYTPDFLNAIKIMLNSLKPELDTLAQNETMLSDN